MSKNILVITGSPRKHGNSDLLSEAFIKGADESGHSVSKFEAASLRIDGCKACDRCWSLGKPCVFDDGFSQLAPLLEKAEVLVLCTPVYWFGMSSQIKLAIDKFYAYVRPKSPRKLQIKESVLIACAGDDDNEVFDGLVGTYNGIVNYLGFEDKGMLLVPSVYNPGDVSKTKALEAAEDLGRQI